MYYFIFITTFMETTYCIHYSEVFNTFPSLKYFTSVLNASFVAVELTTERIQQYYKKGIENSRRHGGLLCDDVYQIITGWAELWACPHSLFSRRSLRSDVDRSTDKMAIGYSVAYPWIFRKGLLYHLSNVFLFC